MKELLTLTMDKITGAFKRAPSSYGREDILCLAVALSVTIIFSLLTFNKMGIASEGWYTVYSNLILSGLTPYSDFDLLFPPLYTYIMVFINALFGDYLIVYRVFGILVFAAIALTAFLLLRLIANPWLSAIGTIILVSVMQSENTFIAYDYIRFYDLSTYLTFLLIGYAFVKFEMADKRADILMLIAGIICSFSIMFRQTSGLIVATFLVVALLILWILVKKATMKQFGLFVLGLIAPFAVLFICLAINGTVAEYLDMTIFSGSKGSIADMLFKWFGGLFDGNTLWPYIPNDLALFFVVTAISILLIRQYLITKDNKESEKELIFHKIIMIAVAITSIISLMLFYSGIGSSTVSDMWHDLTKIMLFINLYMGIYLLLDFLIRLKKKEETNNTMLFIMLLTWGVFFIQWGSGTSGGPSLGQGALNFALTFVLILKIISHDPIDIRKILCYCIIAVIACALIMTSFAMKTENPYFWWGLNETPIYTANEASTIDYYGGMYLSSEDNEMYEDYVNLVSSILDEDDELYCYSQVMVFYTLANKLPFTKAPIAWFDVSRDSTIMSDLNYMKANNPKMIVFADHGEWVISSHEAMFNGKGYEGHRALYDWLLKLRDSSRSQYDVVREYTAQDYHIYVMVRNY